MWNLRAPARWLVPLHAADMRKHTAVVFGHAGPYLPVMARSLPRRCHERPPRRLVSLVTDHDEHQEEQR